MKNLYYLEFAKSVNDNNEIIPAKNLMWKTPNILKYAYVDAEVCSQVRYSIQEKLDNIVVRIHMASFIKGLIIRISSAFNMDWMIIK